MLDRRVGGRTEVGEKGRREGQRRDKGKERQEVGSRCMVLSRVHVVLGKNSEIAEPCSARRLDSQVNS